MHLIDLYITCFSFTIVTIILLFVVYYQIYIRFLNNRPLVVQKFKEKRQTRKAANK